MTGRQKSTVLVPLRHRGSFLHHFIPGDGHGGVAFPTMAHLPLGTQVDLELTFMQEQRSYRLKGTVKFFGPPAEEGGPPTVGVAFMPSEKPTLDLVLAFADGKDVAFTERSDTRYPVALQISYKADAAFITDMTDDVSFSGAFIVTERDIPLGTLLPLKLRVPGSLFPVRLHGEVVRQRKEPPAGVGVRFVLDNERTRRRMEMLVEKLKAKALEQAQQRVAEGRARSRPPQ